MTSVPSSKTRFRNRGSLQAVTLVTTTEHRVINGVPAGTFVTNEGYASRTGRVEAMIDTVTPNFHKRINSGEVIFNSMSQLTQELSGNSSGPSLVWTANDAAKGTTYDVSGNWLLMLVGGKAQLSDTQARLRPTLRGNETDIQRAVSEASTKAHTPPSQADILVSLAEAHKTMRLVPDLLNNWSSLFRTFSRRVSATGNKSRQTLVKESFEQSASNLRTLERVATETWLAMRFGVRPLVMDTLGVLKALSGENGDKPIRLTQRGKAGLTSSETVTFSGTYGVVTAQIREERNLNVQVRAMSLMEVRLTKLRDMGVSLAAIPEAAIDLVSFSFVLNWVINVNDFFASLGTALDPGIIELGGCYVREVNSSSLWTPIATTSTEPRFSITKQLDGFIFATETDKRRIVGLEAPKLAVRARPFKFLTDWRLVDAIALLRTVTRGRNLRAFL